MKIAFIGQKGVPATHGGVERHVEELGERLVALGHEVTVFTRPNYTAREMREYKGMHLKSLPTLGTKHLDAIVHSLLATLACWGGGYDIVHYHAIGPCLVSPLARIRGRCVVATIHGQDWRRGKWGFAASSILRLGEWLALRVPHETVCVSETLADRYRSEGHTRVTYIPNGVSIDSEDDTAILDELGVTEGEYILFAGRLVPEKGLHYLLDAHQRIDSAPPLVVAGDTSASDSYVAELKTHAREDVRFSGYVYGPRLAALFRHCRLFVLPSDLEGLPIVLLEAIAYGVPVLASDIPPNVEVLGTRGTFFKAGDRDSLRVMLRDCLVASESMRTQSALLREQALREYDWDQVAQRTSEMYTQVKA